MRWALNGGILALRSLVVIDKLPEIRTNGRTRITSRLPTRVTVETRTTLREAVDFAGRRQAIALVQAGGVVIGAECAAQRALDALGNLGEGHLAVERRKNGAADQSRAAQTGQDGAAKPLYGDAAAIDHRGFGAIDGKRRLVTEIDDPGLASVAAPA